MSTGGSAVARAGLAGAFLGCWRHGRDGLIATVRELPVLAARTIYLVAARAWIRSIPVAIRVARTGLLGIAVMRGWYYYSRPTISVNVGEGGDLEVVDVVVFRYGRRARFTFED